MSDLRDLKKSGALNKRARKYMVLEQDDTSDEESTSFDQAPIQHSSQTSVNDEENCPHYINTEDSSSDDDDVQDERARRIENMSLMDGIRYWALSTKQRHYSINIVLRLFQRANVRVPSDARTLLGTNTSPSTEIVEIGGGQFWYRGIKRCLTSQFRNTKIPSSRLSLNLSVDGLPLHKSSGLQFWPILASIHDLPLAPVMTIAIFCGLKKPENIEQYLRPLVDEMNSLIHQGLTI